MADDKPPRQLPLPLPAGGLVVVAQPLTAESLREPALRAEFKGLFREAVEDMDLRQVVERVVEILEERGVIPAPHEGLTGAEAAARLGIVRATLYRKMEQIPEAEVALVRLKNGRWRWPELEILLRKYE